MGLSIIFAINENPDGSYMRFEIDAADITQP
jgi:hypothetical protein